MKTLDTLILDLQAKLESLSHGEVLEISEEELDLTMANIREAINHWRTPQNRNEFTLRMSNVGQPARKLWYQSRDDSGAGGHFSGWDQMKFLYGHVLEQLLLMLVRVSGHEVTEEQKEIEVEGILGHMDCKIDGEVVDIKTASPFAFKKFENGTLVDDDPFGYIPQLSGYEEAEGTSNGGFLVVDKVSGRIALHRPEDLDKPNIVSRISDIKSQLELDSPPEKCYPDEEHGKKGNRKLGTGCKWCQYKHQCWTDANDGKGLRTFRYANGPIYFTNIEVEPNVEEIL